MDWIIARTTQLTKIKQLESELSQIFQEKITILKIVTDGTSAQQTNEDMVFLAKDKNDKLVLIFEEEQV